jgi:hypothetical protein
MLGRDTESLSLVYFRGVRRADARAQFSSGRCHCAAYRRAAVGARQLHSVQRLRCVDPSRSGQGTYIFCTKRFFRKVDACAKGVINLKRIEIRYLMEKKQHQAKGRCEFALQPCFRSKTTSAVVFVVTWRKVHLFVHPLDGL